MGQRQLCCPAVSFEVMQPICSKESDTPDRIGCESLARFVDRQFLIDRPQHNSNEKAQHRLGFFI